MGNIKTAVTPKQLEIILSSTSLPGWAQLPLETKLETTRLLGEMLIKAAKEAKENEERESDE